MTKTTHPPLSIPQKRWRSRWLVPNVSWRKLHRISQIKWDRGGMVSGYGVSVCGVRTDWQMPGLFSRGGMARCKKCCRSLGIRTGRGAPFNQGVDA